MIHNNKIAALLMLGLIFAGSNMHADESESSKSLIQKGLDAYRNLIFTSSQLRGYRSLIFGAADGYKKLRAQYEEFVRQARNTYDAWSSIPSPSGKFRARIESANDGITIFIADGEKHLSKLATFVLPAGSTNTLSLAFSPDGKHLACANASGDVTFFNVDEIGILSNGVSYLLPPEFEGQLPSWVGFSPDGKYLFVAHSKNSDDFGIFEIIYGEILSWNPISANANEDQESVITNNEFYQGALLIGALTASLAILTVALARSCCMKPKVKQD